MVDDPLPSDDERLADQGRDEDRRIRAAHPGAGRFRRERLRVERLEHADDGERNHGAPGDREEDRLEIRDQGRQERVEGGIVERPVPREPLGQPPGGRHPPGGVEVHREPEDEELHGEQPGKGGELVHLEAAERFLRRGTYRSDFAGHHPPDPY